MADAAPGEELTLALALPDLMTAPTGELPMLCCAAGDVIRAGG